MRCSWRRTRNGSRSSSASPGRAPRAPSGSRSTGRSRRHDVRARPLPPVLRARLVHGKDSHGGGRGPGVGELRLREAARYARARGLRPVACVRLFARHPGVRAALAHGRVRARRRRGADRDCGHVEVDRGAAGYAGVDDVKGFRIVVEEYKGLNVKDGRLFLDPAFAQVSQNFEYRRKGGARVRPGYARLVTDALPDTVVTETLVASDAFNRAGGGLGANWTNRGSGGLLIASNEVYTGSINVFDGAEYASGSFANDQYSLAECRRVDPLVGSYFGLLLRCSSTRAYIGAVLPAGYVIVRITWPGSPGPPAEVGAPGW